MQDKILIHSGGSTYEIPTPFSKPIVFVLPKMVKELHGQWDAKAKAYVILTPYGSVLYAADNAIPSQLPLSIKYCGKSLKKFYGLLSYILRKYYRGESVLKLPMADRYVYRFAIMLSRMAELQPIDDV